MPQWAGSCWYYLRFIDADAATAGVGCRRREVLDAGRPVRRRRRARVLHLLYARFWHKVLFDGGLVTTKEPFQRLFNQGMIHKTSFRDEKGKYRYDHEVEQRPGADGKPAFVKGSDLAVETKLDKMSKSKYNVVNPDDMCNEYGADAMRLYELFMGPLEDGTEWETAGVAGTRRFLDRAWRLAVDAETGAPSGKVSPDAPEDADVERALHHAIKKVTEAVDNLKFNTAISELMIFVNEATRAPRLPTATFEAFVRILAPLAPHVAEELWQRLGHTESITYAPWPKVDERKLQRATITIAVQVTGKLRGTIEVAPDAAEADIIAAAKVEPKVAEFIAGKPIKREIYVKGRLVNLVV
jgi:leucyl-tRNA synthetase